MDKELTSTVRLSDIGEGESCTLVKWGAVPEQEIQRLKNLGVMTGMPVTVSQTTLSGPVVVAVNDAHIAIAGHIAEEILVLKAHTKEAR